MSISCDQCDWESKPGQSEASAAHNLAQHVKWKHEGGHPKRGPGRPRKGPDDPKWEVVGAPAEDSPFAEQAPTESPYIEDKPAGWRDKLWGGDKGKAVATGERKPRKRRVSTEGIWTTLWTAAGAGLCSTGADIPVGNCLQFQAPIVGDILDEAVAGTFVDTLLQPLASSGKRLKKVSSVLAMPVLVGAMERSPGAAPLLEPLLRQAIREHLVAMAPVIKARQKAEVEYKKALTELGMEAGDDPIDAVIDAIFPQLGAPEHNGGKVSAKT